MIRFEVNVEGMSVRILGVIRLYFFSFVLSRVGVFCSAGGGAEVCSVLIF